MPVLTICVSTLLILALIVPFAKIQINIPTKSSDLTITYLFINKIYLLSDFVKVFH